ncbi:uncharacterized protein LOC111052774 [Nilaparvata lugens]|uniref:uncharacterized protein LOC111052774 n=1 Tax=Nilaparvata lugens TaxID=108931 RepID=UPI00193D1545|nr:uncharacterized protein LOC111052774 [Nilaparvata lugens]
MLSDCLGNVRVDTNGENHSDSNHRSETRLEGAKRCVGQGLQQQSNAGDLIFDNELFQSKKRFDDLIARQSETYGDSSPPSVHVYDNRNIESRDLRQKSPVQNDSDFDRECIDSYQKWRAKNTELFATPESALHNVPEQKIIHKMIINNHDVRKDFKSVTDHFESPKKSTLDKYYEYFKRDQPSHSKHYDTGVCSEGKDVAEYGEKSVSHNPVRHQVISSRESCFSNDPKFRISEELEYTKYHDYHKSKPVPYRNRYESEDFILEKGYHHGERLGHGYDGSCCDSPRCKQQRYRLDEDYESRVHEDPLSRRRRHLEEEEELRQCIRNRPHDDFHRSKKDGCSKNSGSVKKSKKSPVLKSKGENRNPCSCPECDELNDCDIEESHCDLVKYKKGKNASQRFRKGVDESDSSLDCFPKRSCINSRKRNSVSFEDLCRFVKLQNEQIMLIQKQVENIGQKVDVIAQKVVKLELQNKLPVSNRSGDRRKSVDNMEKCGCNCEKEKNKAQSFKLSVVKENSQLECLQAVENHNGVSIGVMTSCVEIMQKAQIEQKNVCQKKKTRRENHDDNSDNEQPKHRSKKNDKKKNKKHLKESTRSPTTVNRKQQKEVSAMSDSFNLNEGELQVFREPTPSPEPSIHIDIEDFSSSSSSSGASSDEESEGNANGNSWDTNTDSDDVKMGWTLYNNIVGQVNNILQNPPPSNENPQQLAVPSPEDVRRATLEQLRLLGVNLGEVDNTISKKVTFNQQLYPREEIAKEDSDPVMHLNALAKMYLQQKEFHKGTSRKELADNLRPGNTNLSHATLCYLEKYKIKPGSANRENRFDAEANGPIVTDIPKPQPRRLQQHHNNHHQQQQQQLQHHYPISRILDITELKQQPKLL